MPKQKYFPQHTYTDGKREYFINCIVGTRVTYTADGDRKTIDKGDFSRMGLKPVGRLPEKRGYRPKSVMGKDYFRKTNDLMYAKKN